MANDSLQKKKRFQTLGRRMESIKCKKNFSLYKRQNVFGENVEYTVTDFPLYC